MDFRNANGRVVKDRYNGILQSRYNGILTNNINNLNNNVTEYITEIFYLLIDSAKYISCFRATNRSNVSIKSINNKNLGLFNIVDICTLLQSEIITMFTQILVTHNIKYACKEYKDIIKCA